MNVLLIFLTNLSNRYNKKQDWGAGKFFSGSGSWLFFSSGSGSCFFSQAVPAPVFFQAARLQGAKNTRLQPAPASRLLVKFAKIFFSPQTSKVKRQKNIKKVKYFWLTRVQFPYAFYLLAGVRSWLIFTGSGSWLFFSKRLRLVFFQAALQGAKNTWLRTAPAPQPW